MKQPASLCSDFAQVSYEAWESAAKKALKDAGLSREMEDGLSIALLYTSAMERPPSFVPDNRNFLSRPRIDLPDIEAARAQAMEEVENGCAGLVVTLQGASHSPFGVALKTEKDIAQFLQGLPVERISLRLETGGDQSLFADMFLNQWHGMKMHPGFDPVGEAARTGIYQVLNFTAPFDVLVKYNHKGPAFLVDARLYHNAGASDAQELGFALAHAMETLRHMDELTIPPKEGLPYLSLLLGTDARQFASVLKLRGMRLLWARLTEVLTGAAQSVRLSAETSARMLTAHDAHTNLIRNTLAAFAAVIGGADKITVLPHSSALGLPDAFARRMARNTLSILRDEAHVSKVQDSAAGSFYVEEATAALAARAWDIFQTIERDGGMLSALQSGIVQSMIAQARETRRKALSHGEKQIIGVTCFQNPREPGVAVLEKLGAGEKISDRVLNLCREAAVFENKECNNEGAAA